jgi:hypothetical protein
MDDPNPNDDVPAGPLDCVGELTVANGEALLDEALVIQQLGDDLAEQAWRESNRLLRGLCHRGRRWAKSPHQ